MRYVNEFSSWGKQILPHHNELLYDNRRRAFDYDNVNSKTFKGVIDFTVSSKVIQSINAELLFDDLNSRGEIYFQDILRKFELWADPSGISIDRVCYCLLREIYRYFKKFTILDEPFVLESSMRFGGKLHRVMFFIYIDRLSRVCINEDEIYEPIASSIIFEIQKREETFIEWPLKILSTPDVEYVDALGKFLSLKELIFDQIRKDMCRDLKIRRPKEKFSDPLCPFTDHQLEYAGFKANWKSHKFIKEYYGYSEDYAYRPWYKIRDKIKNLFDDNVDFSDGIDREVIALMIYFGWIQPDFMDAEPTWRNIKRPLS